MRIRDKIMIYLDFLKITKRKGSYSCGVSGGEPIKLLN
jgi:hypothetical protein